MTQGPRSYSLEPRSSALAITSVVLAVLSLLLFCFWFIALPMGALAVVMGVIALRQHARGEAGAPNAARSGIIIGAVAIVLSLVFAVLVYAGVDFARRKLEQSNDRQSLPADRP